MSALHDSPDDGETVDAPPTNPVPDDVAEAVRTLIRWAGDDPERGGLIDTPRGVARAWKEVCAGYADDPEHPPARVFADVGGFDEIGLLKAIHFHSNSDGVRDGT